MSGRRKEISPQSELPIADVEEAFSWVDYSNAEVGLKLRSFVPVEDDRNEG